MTVHARLDPSPVSESFKRSMADLSRRLGERSASQSAPDPSTSAETRQAALQAYDRARLRWLAIVVGGVVAALATGVALASLVPDDPESAPSIVTASVVPTPAASKPTEPPPTVPSVAATETTPSPAPPEPPVPAQTAAIEPAVDPTTLRVDEVKELQVKLRTFGFNPGPADGVAGPMTQSAAIRYQQARGQPHTGTVDRRLLDQLRQDPSPPVVQQVAQRAPRPDATRPAMQGSPPPRRSSDPFEPMRAAGDRFGRWLESVFR